MITFVETTVIYKMNFRLQQFLSAENITQAQFADEIGVARASVSHIIAGRNKPGFDFIQSMSRRYPSLNLEWLINGKGRMYKEDRPEPPGIPAALEEGQLFDQPALLPDPPAPRPEPKLEPEPEAQKMQDTTIRSVTTDSASLSKSENKPQPKRIRRIVVFYDDNTYQELQEV